MNSIEKEAEKTAKTLLEKYYKRGFHDGYKARERELHPVHYCRECVFWAGDVKSIGRKCINTHRRQRLSSTSNYKYPSNKACKDGFRPRPKENEYEQH